MASTPRMRETSVVDQPRRSTTSRDPPGRKVLRDKETEPNPESLLITNRRRTNSGDNGGDSAVAGQQDVAMTPASASELVMKQVLVTMTGQSRSYSNVSL